MDDWAAATVGDLEDRTRIRAIPTPQPQGSRRKRRTRGYDTTGDRPPSVGTVRPAASRRGSSGSASAASRTATPSSSTNRIARIVVAASLLVIAIGGTSVAVLMRAANDEIPAVQEIRLEQRGDTARFSWDDVDLSESESYRVVADDGQTSVQRGTSFAVDTGSGRAVCVTVTVLRDGRPGPASPERCSGG